MAERREIPVSYYVYEFSFPKKTILEEDGIRTDVSGVVFYVGKGTSASRMDSHFREAANGCECDKCDTIRLMWDAGLVVVRRIVFETLNEAEALDREKFLINAHMGPHLTNIMSTALLRQIWKMCQHLGLNPQDVNEELRRAWIRASNETKAKQVGSGE